MKQLIEFITDHPAQIGALLAALYEIIALVIPTQKEKSRSLLKKIFTALLWMVDKIDRKKKTPILIAFAIALLGATYSPAAKAQQWQAFKGIWLNGYANATQAPTPPAGYSGITYFADSLGTYVYDRVALDWLRIPGAGGGGTLTGAQNGVGLNGTVVELGFPLIRNTSISQAGFTMQYLNGSDTLVNIGDIAGTRSLNPNQLLFSIPGVNPGNKPFEIYNHGYTTGNDTTIFPNDRLIRTTHGLVITNWSMTTVNNWRWDEVDNRAEPVDIQIPMIAQETGGEGIQTHYTPPGLIPAQTFTQINRFGQGVSGLTGVSPYTYANIPVNQFKSTIYAGYSSPTTNPTGSTDYKWYLGANNSLPAGGINPLLWLHSEEQKGTVGTFNNNELAKFEMNANGSGVWPSISFAKSQGTWLTKTAANTNAITGRIIGNIYDGSTYQTGASISFTSGATVSAGNAGGNIAFATSNTNTASLTNRLRISQTGTLDVWTGAAWSAGTAGQVLTSTATGTPTWTTVGGGITNTAANTELAKSDGTNLIPSGLFIPSDGNLTMGTGLAGSARVVLTDGTAADVGYTVGTKGAGTINLQQNTSNELIISSLLGRLSHTTELELMTDGNVQYLTTAAVQFGLWEPDGDIVLGGSSLAGGNRQITATSSAASSDLSLNSQGTSGNIFLNSDDTQGNILTNTSGTNGRAMATFVNGVTQLRVSRVSAAEVEIVGAVDQLSVNGVDDTTGGDINVNGGTGSAGTGGSINLSTGTGSTTDGNLTIDVQAGELIFLITRTDCTGAATGTVYNNSGVLNICP